MRMQRSMAILIAGVAVLLLIGVVFALVASRRPETTFPPDSPEGTVATYLRLLQDGQVDEAYALTALEDARPMTLEDFHRQFDRWSQTPHRVTLLRSNAASERASVTVEISTFSSAPGLFETADRTSQQTFTLVRREGTWLITGPRYLYP